MSVWSAVSLILNPCQAGYFQVNTSLTSWSELVIDILNAIKPAHEAGTFSFLGKHQEKTLDCVQD